MQYCALGFDVNVIMSFANNSYLDAPGIAPFARVTTARGMVVVDRLYNGYGDMTSVCTEPGFNSYCNG